MRLINFKNKDKEFPMQENAELKNVEIEIEEEENQ